MTPEPQKLDFELVPDDSGALSPVARQLTPVSHLLYEHFLTVPPTPAITQLVFTRADLEASFSHRLGLATWASWRGFQHYLSPSGSFTALTKLFLRWLIALLMVVIVFCVPMVIAAQFIDQVAALLESAMRHFMWACVYLLAGIIVFAGLIAGAIYAFAKYNASRATPR